MIKLIIRSKLVQRIVNVIAIVYVIFADLTETKQERTDQSMRRVAHCLQSQYYLLRAPLWQSFHPQMYWLEILGFSILPWALYSLISQ